VRVFDLLALHPLEEEREMVRNFLTVEDTVYHMAAEQSHLYLVASVRVDLTVLVDRLEDVGCSGTVRELQLVKRFLLNTQLVPFLEVLYWHVLHHQVRLAVCVLEHQVRFHVLLL
jgi:uncharacterized membrane protein YhaH (DUF805 family)